MAYAALAAAVFALGCALGLPAGMAIVGSLGAVIVMPPFIYVSGFTSLFAIIPDAAISGALCIAAATLVYRLRTAHWRGVLLAGLFCALILGYAVAVSPGWFVGSAFIFIPLFLFCVLDAPGIKVAAARGAVFILAFAMLYAAGLVDYVRVLFAYSARIYFAGEWARLHAYQFATWAVISPALKWTYLVLIIGWALAYKFGGDAVRKAGILCGFLFAAFLAEVGCYLFASFDWIGPIPIYYEVMVAPIYVLGAAAGFASAAGALWRSKAVAARWNSVWAGLGVSAAFPDEARRFAKSSGLLPVLGAVGLVLLAGIWFNKFVVYGTRFSPGLVNILNEPWASNERLISYLRGNAGLGEDGRFRGSVVVRPAWDYPGHLTMASLWRELVPTLAAYNTFESPAVHFFIQRSAPYLFDRSFSELPKAGTITGDRLLALGGQIELTSDKVLQALGVRYFVSAVVAGSATPAEPVVGDSVRLREEAPASSVAGSMRGFQIYEYDHPNLSNYSPTEPVIVDDAMSVMRTIWSRPFDPRKSVLMFDPLPGPLVPAGAAEMRFERGAVRVKARSGGRSLVVLPLDYSNCLSVERAGPGRLVRANLIQTGVLFEGEIDLRIRFNFGLFHSACRKQDLKDLASLKVFKETRDIFAASHPHAVRGFAGLGAAVKAFAMGIVNAK